VTNVAMRDVPSLPFGASDLRLSLSTPVLPDARTY
jgi:hypothetical protein